MFLPKLAYEFRCSSAARMSNSDVSRPCQPRPRPLLVFRIENPRAPELCDLRLAHAELLAQNLAAVFAEQGRLQVEFFGKGRELEREAGNHHLAQDAVGDLEDHV